MLKDSGCLRLFNFYHCSDEIYANSIFKEAHFVSMASILEQASPALQAKGRSLVHTVFGLSKDWSVALAASHSALASLLDFKSCNKHPHCYPKCTLDYTVLPHCHLRLSLQERRANSIVDSGNLS